MFLEHLHNRIMTLGQGDNFIFVTMDIESLFTCIPNLWGIDKVREFLTVNRCCDNKKIQYVVFWRLF